MIRNKQWVQSGEPNLRCVLTVYSVHVHIHMPYGSYDTALPRLPQLGLNMINNRIPLVQVFFQLAVGIRIFVNVHMPLTVLEAC